MAEQDRKGPLEAIHVHVKKDDLEAMKKANDIIGTILQNCTSDSAQGEKVSRDMAHGLGIKLSDE